jgi:hypothetical protein
MYARKLGRGFMPRLPSAEVPRQTISAPMTAPIRKETPRCRSTSTYIRWGDPPADEHDAVFNNATLRGTLLRSPRMGAPAGFGERREGSLA